MNNHRREFSACVNRGGRAAGFTLIEVMIVVAIVAILSSIALPAYSDYMRRGQVQEAFGYLSDSRVKMEQYYQDNRNYGPSSSACASVFAPPPNAVKYFTFSCSPNTRAGDTLQQSYTVTATGVLNTQAFGHVYTINEIGDRYTTKFKNVDIAAPGAKCWLSKSNSC